jgi:hypothetical protein
MVLQLCGRVCRRLSLEKPCFQKKQGFLFKKQGTLAQMVEQWTENPCVPGSIPGGTTMARMVKLVDTLDLKSSEQQCSCGFKSRSEYYNKNSNCFYTIGVFFIVLRAGLEPARTLLFTGF